MTDPKRDAGRRSRYYAEAASWSADVHGALRASRRLAWWVAGTACAVAALEALALTALAPLKTVVPYAISVDRQTGFVETVRPLAPGALSQDQAVTQANLVEYVTRRETFDATDLSDAYRKVVLFSAGEARDQYVRLMKRTTPESPLNLNSASTVVQVTVKSVSLLSPTTALVRFDTTRREQGAGTGEQRSYVAAIAFRYTTAPATMGDRFQNPLGFQVTRYRRDAEQTAPTTVVLPSAAGSVTAAPAPVAATVVTTTVPAVGATR